MKYRELVKLLERDGWFWKRSSGSHRIYKHPIKAGTVVLAYHGSKDVPEGTTKSIIKEAGLE